MLTSSQTAVLALWQQVNASLSAYNKLIKAFFNPENAWHARVDEWQAVGLHQRHLDRHRNSDTTDQFIASVDKALNAGRYQLIFADQSDFPNQLSELYDPPPLLFVKGNSDRLHDAQIAIVGSRKPTPHAQKITFDIAQYLAQSGYVITSGLAQGVDLQAHLGALSQSEPIAKGRTVGVMGTGIDVCYPRHHDQLFAQIVAEGGCIVSELLPSMPANKHTFPRRNRLVAGLALGTIVTEATVKSGSLITARLTSEQGKQVFAIPSHIDNSNAEGCHHLIREGATLIYHPKQVIDDLRFQQTQPSITPPAITVSVSHETSDNLPSKQTASKETLSSLAQPPTNHQQLNDSQVAKSTANNQPPSNSGLPLLNTKVPEHLNPLFTQIDWNGTDIDQLIEKQQIDIQTLLGQLMELELMGLIMQQGGRYVRV